MNIKMLNKSAILLICLVLIVCPIIITAIEECPKRAITTDETACYIYLPINSSANNCGTFYVEIYSNTTLLHNYTLLNTTNPLLCESTFNETSVGTYTLRYSSGDTGSIVLSGGTKMIEIFYFGLIVAVILGVLGLFLHNQPILAIDGFLLLIMGFWMWIYGYSIFNNLITQMIGTVLLALGGYIIIMSTLSMVDGDNDSMTD